MIWRGHLSVTTDQKNFLLQVHAGVAERWTDDQAEDLARDHSAGPPVESPGSVTGCSCPPAVRRRLLLVDFPVFHHELHVLQHADVCSGSPDTAIISAYFPGLMDPKSSEWPSRSAALVVAD